MIRVAVRADVDQQSNVKSPKPQSKPERPKGLPVRSGLRAGLDGSSKDAGYFDVAFEAEQVRWT